MGVRGNNKKMNYKQIYSQIAKYGKTIPEMAEKYEMEEEAFIKRIQMGLEPKLFSNAMSASEKNIKHRQKAKRNNSAKTTKLKQEEEKMSKKGEVKALLSYRQQQSEKDKLASIKEKRQTLEELKNQEPASSESEMDILEKEVSAIDGEISKEEKELDTDKLSLASAEKALNDKQKAFEEASKNLEVAKKQKETAEKLVEQRVNGIKVLKSKKESVKKQITELKNKNIYLVAPGYTGEKLEYGTFYSTTKVDGFETLSTVEANPEFAIEPELKDMLVTGYDSYKEYSNALRFVMLCAEYACKEGVEYSVLVDDERLKKLIKKHVG